MANPLNLPPSFRKFVEQMLCCWSPTSLTVGTLTATDINVSDDLVVSDDLTANGLFTRSTVAQPVIRKGTGTLVGGTLVITGQTWVTADPATVIQITYTGGATVIGSPSYTLQVGTGFTVFGTGTSTFAWTAFTDAT